MNSEKTRIFARIPRALKEDVRARLPELGYDSITSLLKDFLSIVAYGYESVPKNNSLPNIDGILEPVLSQSKLAAQKNDFFEFMTSFHENHPDYLRVTSRVTEAEFMAKFLWMDPEDLDRFLESPFIKEFHVVYGYTPTPNELQLFVKAFYRDSTIHKKQQEIYTAESRRIALEYGTAKQQIKTQP